MNEKGADDCRQYGAPRPPRAAPRRRHRHAGAFVAVKLGQQRIIVNLAAFESPKAATRSTFATTSATDTDDYAAGRPPMTCRELSGLPFILSFTCASA